MKLMFIGADHEVTGSCHYVECGDGLLYTSDAADDRRLV